MSAEVRPEIDEASIAFFDHKVDVKKVQGVGEGRYLVLREFGIRVFLGEDYVSIRMKNDLELDVHTHFDDDPVGIIHIKRRRFNPKTSKIDGLKIRSKIADKSQVEVTVE